MLTALDAPADALDEDERSFLALIREHGWARRGVFADEEGPGFSYTTGFWVTVNQPELILFGIKDEVVHDVFWDLFHDGKEGRHLPPGTRTDNVFGSSPVYAFAVAKRHYESFLGWDRWFYAGDDFPCLQLVWPDRAGLFPWEPGADPAFQNSQPDLTDGGWLASLAN
jgi:hypothetical protein